MGFDSKCSSVPPTNLLGCGICPWICGIIFFSLFLVGSNIIFLMVIHQSCYVGVLTGEDEHGSFHYALWREYYCLQKFPRHGHDKESNTQQQIKKAIQEMASLTPQIKFKGSAVKLIALVRTDIYGEALWLVWTSSHHVLGLLDDLQSQLSTQCPECLSTFSANFPLAGLSYGRSLSRSLQEN